MTTTNPIVPPPELFTEWLSEALLQHDAKSGTVAAMVADKAAQWGADQELEACCEWLDFYAAASEAKDLRAARRPKPPSLKERALAALDGAVYMADDSPPEGISTDQADIIRRALEALPE